MNKNRLIEKHKILSLQRLSDERSCTKGMKLNLWIIQAIWNIYLNIDISIPNLPSNMRSRIIPVNIISSISVCEFKLLGVRLRELPRSIKSWGGTWLFAPKVFPKGYPAPDNNLWLCRNLLIRTIC